MTFLVYTLTQADGSRPPITESFVSRFEALSRLDDLLRQHRELSLVEVITRRS